MGGNHVGDFGRLSSAGVGGFVVEEVGWGERVFFRGLCICIYMFEEG